MLSKDLPPQKPNPVELVRSFIRSEQSVDRKEPHVVFIAHNVSISMKDILEKEGITFEQFITRTCLEYIKQQKREKLSAQKYVDYSEMQLFELKTKSSDSSFSDDMVDLKSSICISREDK